jgi:hypothetical protein
MAAVLEVGQKLMRWEGLDPNGRRYLCEGGESQARRATGELLELVFLAESAPLDRSSLKFQSQLLEALGIIKYDVIQYVSPLDCSTVNAPIVPVIMITIEKLDGNGDFVKFKTGTILTPPWPPRPPCSWR